MGACCKATHPQLGAMSATINVRVRAHLKLPTSKYTDTDMECAIEDALAFLNKLTGETYTIADYSNATTGDINYDALIRFLALWNIHVEIYKGSVDLGEGAGNLAIARMQQFWKQEFMSRLMACYPGLVEMGKGGLLEFADMAFAGLDVGRMDGRFDGTDGVKFDSTGLGTAEGGNSYYDGYPNGV